MAQELRALFGSKGVRVLACLHSVTPNAKIDAMATGIAAARHEVVLFSDDDIRVDQGHLSSLMAQMHRQVGIVSAAAVGTEPDNFWGELEIAFMNGQFARLHLAGDFLGCSGALGKAMMMRRSELAGAGGLYRSGGDCCEDAALTRNFATRNLVTVLSELPVVQPVRTRRLLDVASRHMRWLSCRRRYVPKVFVCEALFSTPVASVAGAFVFNALLESPVSGAVITAALWATIKSTFFLLKGWHWSLKTPAAWMARELLLLPLWVWATFARLVDWHGRLVPVTNDDPAYH